MVGDTAEQPPSCCRELLKDSGRAETNATEAMITNSLAMFFATKTISVFPGQEKASSFILVSFFSRLGNDENYTQEKGAFKHPLFFVNDVTSSKMSL